MSVIVWPFDLLTPRNLSVDPAYRSVSGGVALNGFSQVIASDAGIWRVVFDKIVIHSIDHVKAWRAIRAHTEGRLNPILISLCEGGIRPVVEKIKKVGTTVSHSDGAYFSDTTGYQVALINIRVAANAKLRATVLELNKIEAGELEPGQRFSIGERLYEIRKVVSQTTAHAQVEIWPPLRETVAAGSDTNFDRPVLRVRLATDSEMDLMLDLNRFASPTVNFLEDMST